MRAGTRLALAGAMALTLAALRRYLQNSRGGQHRAQSDIPEPTTSWLPDRLHRQGRAAGRKAPSRPRPTGLAVNAFASGLDHPRWLYVLPNGDVLVAETNEPKKDDTGFSIKGWIMGW